MRHSGDFRRRQKIKESEPEPTEFAKGFRGEAETLQLYAAAGDRRGAFRFKDVFEVCDRIDRLTADKELIFKRMGHEADRAAKLDVKVEDLTAENKTKDEEIERLRKLLQRCKKLFEPFPIVSDLKSMTAMLREKCTETDAGIIEKMFKDRETKYRKLYRDIEQALKAEDKDNG